MHQSPYAARDVESGMLYCSMQRMRRSDGGWSSHSEEGMPNVYLTPSPPATPEKYSHYHSHSAKSLKTKLEFATIICWGIALFAMGILAAYLTGMIKSAPVPSINCREGDPAWTRRCERLGYDDYGNVEAVGYLPLPQNGA
jgi:hypothetical protein